MPTDQFQDLRSLALGAGRFRFFPSSWLSSLPDSIYQLLRRRGFGAGFLTLGASFLGLALFFEPACVGATGAPYSATVAAVSVLVASAFVMVGLILSAVDPRMTIHHSGAAER